MLDDPQKRAEWAKKNVEASKPPRRPGDYDGLEDDWLNSLDGKFFRNRRVNLQVPLLPSEAGLRALQFLEKHVPGLIAAVKRESSDRSKSLLIRDTLQHWSKAFSRWGK